MDLTLFFDGTQARTKLNSEVTPTFSLSEYHISESSDIIEFKRLTNGNISKSSKSRFQAFSIVAKGNKKQILGHEVEEYELISVNKVKVATLWIATDMPAGLAPSMPIFSKGTVLESVRRNGTRYTAKKIEFKKLDDINWELSSDKKKSFHILEADNKPFPKFNFKDINGKVYSNESLRGKVVVLNFWFTGCAPCIAELPDVNELRNKYKNENVVFLSLTFNNENQIKKFLTKRKFEYDHIPNEQSFIDQIGLSEYPTHVVIDKAGIVRVSASTPLNPMILENIYEVIDSNLK